MPEKRNDAIEQINSMNVPCYSGTCSEVFLEKAFDDPSFRPDKRLKNAETLGESSLMFLVHPTLTEQELNATCKAIEDVFN